MSAHALGSADDLQGDADSAEPPQDASAPASRRVSVRKHWLQLAHRERYFLMLLGLGFLVAGATYDMPRIAMWLGFAFAGYAAVSNDSIQTLGTFLASNKHRPWWLLWLFAGGIFVVTVAYSWATHGGDVSYGRLSSKGLAEATVHFSFLQVAAPLFLILITRMRMPVSTTFLLLSCFGTTRTIEAVLGKSLMGYVIAFGAAIFIWVTLGRWMQQRFRGEPHAAWLPFQWCTTGLLWSVWLMQDMANVAVFLPRAMSGYEFLAFAALIFIGLGVLFRMGGERVQEVVDEKSGVVDVRAATVIDLIYAVILYLFKFYSQVPMSTTWVFLGLLGGRELALSLRKANANERSWWESTKLLGRDGGYALAGLLVSLVLAAAANPDFREALASVGE